MKIEFSMSDEDSQTLKRIATDRGFRSAAALSKSLIEDFLAANPVAASNPVAANPDSDTTAKPAPDVAASNPETAAIPPPPSTPPPKTLDSGWTIDVSKYEV